MMLLAILFTAMAGGGEAAYASTSSLPEDALYPVKTTIEEAQLILAGDQEDFNLHLAFANRRLEEVEALVNQERFGEVAVAASGYEEQLAQIERLRMEAGPFGQAYGEMQTEQFRTRLELHARRLRDLEDSLSPGVMLQIRMMN
jgi:Domain of unknown function (DUF5667)